LPVRLFVNDHNAYYEHDDHANKKEYICQPFQQPVIVFTNTAIRKNGRSNKDEIVEAKDFIGKSLQVGVHNAKQCNYGNAYADHGSAAGKNMLGNGAVLVRFGYHSLKVDFNVRCRLASLFVGIFDVIFLPFIFIDRLGAFFASKIAFFNVDKMKGMNSPGPLLSLPLFNCSLCELREQNREKN
jgi:hypothetical protein